MASKSKRYSHNEVVAIRDFLERRMHSSEVAARAVMSISQGELAYWEERTKEYYRLVGSVCKWLLSTITQSKRTDNGKNKSKRKNKIRIVR